MTRSISGINPDVLKWARICSGLTLEEVAKRLKKDISVIQAWESESGISAPTYIQLENLAYKLYKRPLALFFFPSPPEEINPKKSFRTLPQEEMENLRSDTLYAIREAKARQYALYELNDGVNRSDKKIFLDISLSLNSNIINATLHLRQYLGISLEDQINWLNHREAMENWRNLIQDKGVFVFKRSFKQKDISGFCLVDQEFPVIYINNSSALFRQIFSLFHELAHILLNMNSISKLDDSYIDYLGDVERKMELFCNRFSAEFLVPISDFNKQVSQYNKHNADQFFKNMANRYKVSREVILRRLLSIDKITNSYYNEKVDQWKKEYISKKKGEGGDYYATQATYLGERFINLAFNKFYQGHCTINQLADYLNIKEKNISNLEHYLIKGVA